MSRYKSLILLVIALLVVALAMFAYENFFKSSDEDLVAVLLASKAIPGDTIIDESMIAEKIISSRYVLTPYATDREQIIGKATVGVIMPGEPIMLTHLQDVEGLKTGIYELVVGRGEYAAPIEIGDLIGVYVRYTKKSDNTRVTECLFPGKTVTTVGDTYVTIDATPDELTKYMEARDIGDIVMVKFNASGVQGYKSAAENEVFKTDNAKLLSGENAEGKESKEEQSAAKTEARK